MVIMISNGITDLQNNAENYWLTRFRELYTI